MSSHREQEEREEAEREDTQIQGGEGPGEEMMMMMTSPFQPIGGVITEKVEKENDRKWPRAPQEGGANGTVGHQVDWATLEASRLPKLQPLGESRH
ncbi:hypothetical protein NHX12_014711 [Muraenolepis orangiensis]|uniref:Uncharacterized protein n=1 Tax=Muraenolepis orangiensis TaxID=630683 RepID=A0A9Q0I3S3_9TELE|nr:hypothetical protein NHX12_014702 [Muraenolepis orangiensis]KAJ3584215.1 hypothetical protein NHX12_014711 [Muraenolepis orangiensis]